MAALRRTDSTTARRRHAVGSFFQSNRKAVLKLAAATNVGQFWTAAQVLISHAAPCSIRWLCIRPLRMATAMMLLRETAPESGGSVGKTINPRQCKDGEAALLKELFERHPAILHFRHNSNLARIHLTPEQAGLAARWPSLSETKFGAALAFWKRKQIQGVLLLHRTEKEGDFSEAEIRALRDLHAYLEMTLFRVIATRRQQAQKHTMAGILKRLPLPLVLCDWRSRIVCESAAGLQARAAWALGEDHARRLNLSSRQPLPQDLADFCRKKIMAWEQGTPRERVVLEKREYYLDHPCLPQMRAKLSLLRQKEFPLSKPLFLLRFETRPVERYAVTREQLLVDNAGSLTQLSAAEREVALLVCEGQSNAHVAERLGKSVHTIKAQLQSIFEKLQVKSRSKLTALLMRGSAGLLAVLSCDLLFDAVGLC